MKIDPDGRTIQGVTTLILFVVLNVLYLVTCVPLVTIGAATSSLLEVTTRYADHERGDLVRGYLAAFRRNFARGTAVYLALLVPCAMLVFAGVFWLSMASIPTAVLGLLCLVGAVYLATALACGLGIVGTHTAPIRQTLRSAVLLPLAEPVRAGVLLLIPVAGGLLLYAWPASVVLAATVGCSVAAYGAAFVLRSMTTRAAAGSDGRDAISPHSGQ